MSTSRTSTEFTGEMAGSMADFSSEYMDHIEVQLEADLTEVPGGGADRPARSVRFPVAVVRPQADLSPMDRGNRDECGS